MKHLTALVLFILASCATCETTTGQSAFVDFAKYDGFYLSQSPTADFNYKPLGIVSSYVGSGYETSKNIKSKKIESDGYATGSNHVFR